VFGNAGAGDHFDYCHPPTTEALDAEHPPCMRVLDVNLLGSCYSTLLALKYFRRDPPEVKDKLLVVTSSGTGLYPLLVQPFYGAAKHGIIGLARSVADRVKPEGIRVCALVPGMVPTTIMPQEVIDRTDPNVLTPIPHIVTAVNDMLESDRTSAVCEASVNQLFYRDPPPFPDEAQRKVLIEICPPMVADFVDYRNTKTLK
jgi:NAD(P)-dependent dehydrogenase (short-subunit alcohol dehydrogenase family)